MVRTAQLAAQGLLDPPSKAGDKQDLLRAIRQMGYLQIDTIQAVRRSQYLVLWSRLGQYDPDWLGELHAEGHLFEYYAHALCYLPIQDYPIFRGLMLYDDDTGNGWHHWSNYHLEVIDHVRSVIEDRGPVCSSDFDAETFVTGWGDMKKEKMALERLFSVGELMVQYRKKFRRYYNFRERVLPDWDDKRALDKKTARQMLLLKAVRALGVANEDWVAPYYQFKKTGVTEMLSELVAAGQLELVEVAGWEKPAYVHPDQNDMIDAVESGDLRPHHTTLLSPFDPLVSDRDRALALFGFDYKMESYVPAKDRKFGYFSLPILHRGRLIGRLDPKAHRKEKRMEIKKLYLEPGIIVDESLVCALKAVLADFTTWHEMESLEITATEPKSLREALTA
jgi:uncharacterized protein YcaQ